MTDRDQLLRAVLNETDEDTPRLVLADCLDEIGGKANASRGRLAI